MKTLEELTQGQLADVVIDATGSHHSMVRSLEFATFTGRVVYVGITQQNLVFPHAPIMHRRELTIMASRNALPKDFIRIIKLIGEGKIDTNTWITHRTPFADLAKVFPEYLKPDAGVLKAVVEM